MARPRALTATFLALIVLLAAACEDDAPQEPPTPPDTVPEFFEALEFALTEDGRPYHATLAMEYIENGQPGHWGTTEVWLDLARDRARWEFRKGSDNTADIAGHVLHVYADEAQYSLNLEIEGERVGRLDSRDLRECIPEAPTFLLGLLYCGFAQYNQLEGATASVEPSTFEGVPTLALLAAEPVQPQSFPTNIPPPPGGWPTPHPVYAAAKQGQWRLHIDPATFLPIAFTQTLDSDPAMATFGGVMRFEGGFIEESGLPPDAFSPQALGYVEPAEEERRQLEDPKLETPVYWLGRSFDPGNGLPALGNLDVNSYNPGGQRGGDEPNIQIGIAYRGADASIRLDHYPPGDWEEFKARLGGNFPWTWCAESREFTAGDARVTILAGHESFPYEFDGSVIAVRPGETPPTPAPPMVPPLKTEPCPTTPHDRFMAEVRFPDATIIINGPLAYGGQDGSHYGPFDTAEALETLARNLRPRQPGE